MVYFMVNRKSTENIKRPNSRASFTLFIYFSISPTIPKSEKSADLNSYIPAWPSESIELFCSELTSTIFIKALLPEARNLDSDVTTTSDFVLGDEPKQKQFPYLFSCAVPSESIAACARGQTVFDGLWPALSTLNDVINFPTTIKIMSPASFCELDRITTEVTVSLRFLEDLPELAFIQPNSPPSF